MPLVYVGTILAKFRLFRVFSGANLRPNNSIFLWLFSGFIPLIILCDIVHIIGILFQFRAILDRNMLVFTNANFGHAVKVVSVCTINMFY